MPLPIAPFVQPTYLADANGSMSEGVNKVAIYYWDSSSLSWVKATGGSVPGQNVNVTNFPPVQAVSLTDGADVTLGAIADAAVTTNTTGTISAKLRGIVAILANVWDSVAGVLKTRLVVPNVLNPATTIDVKGTPDGGLLINQNIQIDPANSSTANLAVGASFVGGITSNITASMIQIFLKTDQNCTVYLDQYQNGVNPDISDSFNFLAAVGNFGINVGAFGAFFRVRVTNVGVATTTYFRLQTIYVPIANQLPRTLSPLGWLQTQINHIQDDSGFEVGNTPFGEMQIAPTIKIIGSLFPGNTLDTAFWTAVVGTGGSVAPVSGLLTMQTGTTANNATSLTTINNARFIAGHTNKFKGVVVLGDTGVIGNTRRGGAYTATDGVFFELAGTTFSIATRKNSVDTKVSNGSFNGILGAQIALDTNAHTWDIVYTSYTVWFFFDGNLLHTARFNTTWSSTLNLPIQYENFNSGGLAQNVILYLFGSTIARNGQFIGQPQHFFQSGITAGQTLKIGPGGLQGMLISNVTNNASVTLYDSLTASGTIIWQSGAMGAQTIPFSLDFKGISFNTGLVLVISGAACNALVLYE